MYVHMWCMCVCMCSLPAETSKLNLSDNNAFSNVPTTASVKQTDKFQIHQ